nr:hypothetical protein [Tanacetum cinerariifolium]
VVAKVGTSSSTPAISSEVVELKDMVRALLMDKKNQSLAPTPSTTPAPVKAVESNCVTCGGPRSKYVEQVPEHPKSIPKSAKSNGHFDANDVQICQC